jgi:hypothetical protein
VQLRIERQALIRRATVPLALRVALNESVLRRPIGGREVMAEQLDALAEAAELPNVKIRVVPFTAGLHHGVMTGPFELLRFPANGDGRDSEPPTIFQDGYTGGLYLDKANEIERFSDAFEYVWTAAASEDASIRMIRQAAEDFRGRRS